MKKRYVYFNKKTGQILEIRSNRKQGRAFYIECDNEDVVGFITGEKGINNYLILKKWGNDSYEILPKDNIIHLIQTSAQPVKMPYKSNVLSDLTLVYYPDNILEATLDLTNIAPIFQSNFQSEVKFEKGTEIRIIIKEKDSGNLLKEFIINAQKLLDSGQIFLELDKHIHPDNVEFFTYDLFEKISWYKGKVKLISPVKENIKFDIHKADNKKRSDGFSYHLIMEKNEKGLKIINNIDNFKLVRFNKEVNFFVVDKYDPNILFEKFSIKKEDLKHKTILIPLKYNIKGKTILYNHKYISVLLKG